MDVANIHYWRQKLYTIWIADSTTVHKKDHWQKSENTKPLNTYHCLLIFYILGSHCLPTKDVFLSHPWACKGRWKALSLLMQSGCNLSLVCWFLGTLTRRVHFSRLGPNLCIRVSQKKAIHLQCHCSSDRNLSHLGGGFKYFLFSSLLGEDEPILTSIFFKGVGSTTN